ncbi:MAG TPA: hypothetical protein VHL31_10755 [Geminicoccus sp.]|jgi:hypothetical protein|uniref:hypothetical protein n=1 Tax=Geminicoccus sp. TaxID=2024832 RepID=UPI002E3658E2|nr:hypothetical protein [Geminicoccus sp.]HEX2526760.1 hypothetical protein [Geminicoccus sp.]
MDSEDIAPDPVLAGSGSYEDAAEYSAVPPTDNNNDRTKKTFGHLGRRFGVWLSERVNGRDTKVPYRATGQKDREGKPLKAKSNDASTWVTLEEAIEFTTQHPGYQLAVFLGDLDDRTMIVGVDLDLCRSPTTGEIQGWAQEVIDQFDSYAEVSPSGTGVKIFCLLSGDLPLPGGKLGREVTLPHFPRPEGSEGLGHETPEIGLYFAKRFFAIDGRSINGKAISDATEAIPWLIERLDELKQSARGDVKDKKWLRKKTSQRRSMPVEGGGTPGELPDAIKNFFAADEALAAAWREGTKIGPGSDASASGLDLSLAVTLHRAGLPWGDIARTLRLYPHGQIGSGNLQAQDATRRLIRIREAIETYDEVRGDLADDERPELKLAGSFLHAAVERCERELGAQVDQIFQRGGQLVRVARRENISSGSITRAAGSLQIVPYDQPTMRVTLTRLLRFLKYDKRAEDWFPADCPRDLAEAVIAGVGNWPNVRTLRAVVQSPTIKPDGSILSRPGYDPDTGLFLDLGGMVFPEVPDQPTKDEALASLKYLKAIVQDFPFATDADRSAWLAYLITAVVRTIVRAAPMTLITAPVMASGKTLLASLPGYVVTGKAPSMMSQADDVESERKRLLAVLLEGDALAVIDNVERPLGSDALCSILTETSYRDRILGQTKTVEVPTTTTWCATGNNLVIAGDLSKRTSMVRIDPKVERPEEREFPVNLHEWVPAHRGEIVAAILCILRAHVVAGRPRPENVSTFGRYEEWERWCRFPLIWLGEADPLLTRARIEANDPIKEQLGAILTAWTARYGTGSTTVAQAAADAVGDLKEAMLAIAGERGEVNGRRLGRWIAKHEGRIDGGLRFVRMEEIRTGMRWRVERAAT